MLSILLLLNILFSEEFNIYHECTNYETDKECLISLNSECNRMSGNAVLYTTIIVEKYAIGVCNIDEEHIQKIKQNYISFPSIFLFSIIEDDFTPIRKAQFEQCKKFGDNYSIKSDFSFLSSKETYLGLNSQTDLYLFAKCSATFPKKDINENYRMFPYIEDNTK